MKNIHFNNIDSTNKYLLDHQQDYDELVFVSASYQRCGKGREDRRWESEEGKSLLFSFLIKDKNLLKKYSCFSLATANAVRSSLLEIGVKNVTIKWPNDVYINDKKVCGILLQGSLPDYLVVGVGINLNQDEFIGEYRISPTSVKIETKNFCEIEQFKGIIYSKIIKMIDDIALDDYLYLQEVKKYDYLKGKFAIVSSYNNDKKVNVIGINDHNNLLIEDEGKIIEIFSGEITSY